MLDSRGHGFELRMPATPVIVDGDGTCLMQVIANLLNSAAKYTPAAGHITLDLVVCGRSAEVRVSDDGVGISPELLPHIFELFTQAERTPDRAHSGLGAGLALVRSVVHLHGGRVSATSAGEGRGSTFVVAVPLSDARPVQRSDPRRRSARIGRSRCWSTTTSMRRPRSPRCCAWRGIASRYRTIGMPRSTTT